MESAEPNDLVTPPDVMRAGADRPGGGARTIARAAPGDETVDDLVQDELLVEEISIDGMCGVY